MDLVSMVVSLVQVAAGVVTLVATWAQVRTRRHAAHAHMCRLRGGSRVIDLDQGVVIRIGGRHADPVGTDE
ncbi:hypothetical protein [Spirillospora sp. CA-294931]|uniref:hypothetical protein n=1 Tax=Spirillospora sp. CA-294931 TaxID=3240042 RepID=UPI003D8F6915